MENEYWWIKNIGIENERASGEIRFALVSKYSDYSKLKKIVWIWFRSHTDSNLSSRAKIILWAICERWNKYQTWSCPDSFEYLGSMLNMHRSTVAKGIYELVDNDVIWLVEESERRGMKRIKQHSRKRKHILLVGLGTLLSDHLV